LSKQSVRDDVQIVSPIISFTWSKECQVEITIVMVNGTTAAISACQRNACLFGCLNITFKPGILMAAKNHTGIVPPEQQNMMLGEVKVAIQPVL